MHGSHVVGPHDGDISDTFQLQQLVVFVVFSKSLTRMIRCGSLGCGLVRLRVGVIQGTREGRLLRFIQTRAPPRVQTIGLVRRWRK